MLYKLPIRMTAKHGHQNKRGKVRYTWSSVYNIGFGIRFTLNANKFLLFIFKETPARSTCLCLYFFQFCFWFCFFLASNLFSELPTMLQKRFGIAYYFVRMW